ncbi:MAG: MFS transporter, partial [Solimonas sp.]
LRSLPALLRELVINFVLSQRSIYGPKPESRSRIGGLFTAIFFLGGAAGSAVAAASFATIGWPFTCLIGLGLAACAFVLYLRESAMREAT